MIEWISIKDRLPEENKIVLLYLGNETGAYLKPKDIYAGSLSIDNGLSARDEQTFCFYLIRGGGKINDMFVKKGRLSKCNKWSVSHWAEINEPDHKFP